MMATEPPQGTEMLDPGGADPPQGGLKREETLPPYLQEVPQSEDASIHPPNNQDAKSSQIDSPSVEPSSRLKGVLAAVSYGTLSMSAVLVNKAVLSSWEFNYPLIMIASQMAISFFLLWALRKCELIQYDDWSMETAKKIAPMALIHVGNVFMGLVALNLVDIPMFGALRRTSIIFVLVMEYIVMGKKSSVSVWATTIFILFGAIVGGWGDLHFDLLGYTLTGVVNITTSLALTLIPKLGTAANLNPFGMMLYQVTISFPLVLIAIIYSGEIEALMYYPHLFDVNFQMAFLISATQIFLVNYTIFLCTQLNSPLTTTVTGTVKNMGELILGFAFFNVPINIVNLSGIAIGFTGSLAYTVVKYFEHAAAPPKK